MAKTKIKDILHLFSPAELAFIKDHEWDEDDDEITLGERTSLVNRWSTITVFVNHDATEAEIWQAARDVSGYFTVVFDNDDEENGTYYNDEFHEC